MKKRFAVILALLMCLVCIGCRWEYPYYDMEIENHSYRMAAMMLYALTNLSELEERPKEFFDTAIVQGRVMNDPKRITLEDNSGKFNRHGYPIPSVYITEYSLRITKVHEGDIEAGSIIPLLESWYIEKTDEGEKLMTLDGYMPSDPEKEYIFFLRANKADLEGTYSLVDDEVGRFPIPNASTDPAYVTERESYRTSYMPYYYRSIYAEIIEKYF